MTLYTIKIAINKIIKIY